MDVSAGAVWGVRYGKNVEMMQ